MKHYLVTGGAGFIGSHVCDALIGRGDKVVCIDDFNDYYDPDRKRKNVASLALTMNNGFEPYAIDIRRGEDLDRVFAENERFDAVIHLAARAGVRPSIENPGLYVDVNVGGTMNVLQCARNHFVPKIVFASSSSVYGERTEVPFREGDPLAPISPYAFTKLTGEQLGRLDQEFGGVDSFVALRFFTVYGPRGRPDMAPSKFLHKVRDGQEIEMFGDGSSERDYTYIDDIVRGILAATDTDLGFEIINLGNGQPHTLGNFVHTVEAVVGNDANVKQVGTQEGDVSRTFADVTKARGLLDWEAEVPLGDGLRRTYEWIQAQ